MKRITFLCAILCVCFYFASCKAEEPVKQPENQEFARILDGIKTRSFSEEILSFSSKEEMEKTIQLLAPMSDEEIERWYATNHPGFVSLWKVYQNALNDIDFLGENEDKISLDDANRFKENYADYLLFNDDPADEELYNPYLPTSNEFIAYVTNIYGNVRIAGEVVNLNDLKSVKETLFYKAQKEYQAEKMGLTRANTTKETFNYLYIYNENAQRKMWAETYKNGNKRYIKLSAHKKRNFLGWDKCKAKYHLKYIYYIGKTWKTIPEIVTWCMNNSSNTYNTGDVSSGHKVYIGETRRHYLTPTSFSWAEGVVGFQIWSGAVLPIKGTFRMVNDSGYTVSHRN